MTRVPPFPADAVRLLQEYLDHAIPLVSHMQVSVASFDDEALTLTAPLEPNRNHIGTVFGGSLNGLATLACWGLVWLALHDRGAHIVIHEGRMKFSKPATGNFSAVCARPSSDILESFVTQYAERGRARIALTATVNSNGIAVAEFEGRFAAMDSNRNLQRAG